MDTRYPRPCPPGLVSQEDSGLWMKTDPDPVSDHTDSPSVTCVMVSQDEIDVSPPAPVTQYYSVMDDEGAEDIFILPPSYTAPLRPAEGSTDPMASNPNVTLANWAGDDTEAKANPSGLDWHHGEKQLMAAHTSFTLNEVKASTAQTLKDTVSLSEDEDSTPPIHQDQSSMEDTGSLTETCYDSSGRHYPSHAAEDEESYTEPEDAVIVSGGRENWRETEAEREEFPKEVPTGIEENLESDTHVFENRNKTASGDVCGLAETDSKLTKEDADCNAVETSSQTLSPQRVNGKDLELWGPPELDKLNQTRMDAATNQPQLAEILTDLSNDEENVDTRCLDYNLAKYKCVRRESGTEIQMPQHLISEGFEEAVMKGNQEDKTRKIATDIQQGEQLLQRLQQLQLHQDVRVPESSDDPQQVVQEASGETKCVTGTEEDNSEAREDGSQTGEREGSLSHNVCDDEEQKNLTEMEQFENNETKEVETKARMSLSAKPAESEDGVMARTEDDDSDDDQNDTWVPVDLSRMDPHETSSLFPSSHHRFSAAETVIEKQIHEAAQEKQSLQRAGGLFNLADNPDVLEIPFKTNISLEPLTTTVAQPCQRSDWQFSEQKMQKEISEEIRRELVLVNQGTIPGVYSKGEIRQLKETKLLFEAFQQGNTEGPSRHRRSSLMKGHVYPSVLERTRSLEMFSLKNRPISRAHSGRLYKSSSEMDKNSEGFRSKSPTFSSRDRTPLFPKPKKDKNVRPYRSLDSIISDSTVSETGKKPREGSAHGSPILKHNPFYKLRPALALQPEVEKDIREAKEREEELRRQRCTLYGENQQNSEDGEKSHVTPTLQPDVMRQSRGKLERVWPPPSKKDQMKSEQTQREPKVHRAVGQKAALWQRWESGLVNGQSSKEKN